MVSFSTHRVCNYSKLPNISITEQANRSRIADFDPSSSLNVGLRESPKFRAIIKSGSGNTMVTSDFSPDYGYRADTTFHGTYM